MVDFNDSQQSKKYKEIREKEEEAFVERIANQEGLQYAKLTTTNVETDALILIPEDIARTAFIAAFKLSSNVLYLGVKSPNFPETKKIIEDFSKEYQISVYLVSSLSLEKSWSLYKDVSTASVLQAGMLDISAEHLELLQNQIKKNVDITKKIQEILAIQGNKKTSEIMEVMFAGAIATESSDIHIEAQESNVRVRFRQDGVLQDIVYFDHEIYSKILSRIKLLSEMKITQSSNAQDGRFTIKFKNIDIEVRVSVIPSTYGESFVMRLLNPKGIQVGLESLGIEPKLYEILLKEIKKPNGMILTTGPTGSGKTTTLYSFMSKVYNPEVKIITIEDPVEYHLKGISQTQINRQKGYTFHSGLRAALRQDPDIVMVGEIRDKETATIAVNASLTGHLVLSTLHTNGAAGVIPRLIDLGVSPQILAAALSVSLAQRLVRKICQNCKYEIDVTEYQKTIITNILKRADDNNKPLHEYGVQKNQEFHLYRGRGCDVCNQTGYKGRIGIFEAIITDDLIEELLSKKPSEQEVRRVAEKQGLLNMSEDGIVKILSGVTSFEEVQKVVDLEIINITQHTTTDLQGIEILENSDVINPTEINPEAIFNDKSIEISLLTDYLKKLEHQQIVNPEKDIAQDIKNLQQTIMHLLREPNNNEIFGDNNDKIDTQKKYHSFADELSTLHDFQRKNPSIDMSQKLKRIREDIEFGINKTP
jgi:type IV pilus assembly protein PilB